MKTWLKGGLIGGTLFFIIEFIILTATGSCAKVENYGQCGIFEAVFPRIIASLIWGIASFLVISLIIWSIKKIKSKK